jgi:hypothetical protein
VGVSEDGSGALGTATQGCHSGNDCRPPGLLDLVVVVAALRIVVVVETLPRTTTRARTREATTTSWRGERNAEPPCRTGRDDTRRRDDGSTRILPDPARGERR